MDILEKLMRAYFISDERPHITVNKSICQSCSSKECLYVCPAQRYTLEAEGIQFIADGCLECGACRISCKSGAITWNYPRGGFGVRFRHG
ncbi:Ferredoxin-like, FixX [Moorella glycerini]|uniref:4Fe-4S dicluster domain protein n=1 Tax=Neomoorella stamsii TaxID=1266720 RepID=A0A9X7J626_9FIRM|nr:MULTISPECIES: 4Fe-4S dicluster domain-containing protein [Moorella]PRR77604.1 4Fe-4S dicluster domain protein [Moorella stamsii]CEP68517.1 Ferredoxin-like, FixX [Moorella glycerini]